MTQPDGFTASGQALSDLAKAGAIIKSGVVTAISYPGYVSINVGGSSVPAICGGGQFPAVGDSVLVLQVGTALVCLGAVPKPAHGIVQSSASGNRVSVLADDGVTYSMNYNHLYTPASGDHVKLDWDLLGGYVAGPLIAPGSDPTVDTPSGPSNPESPGPTKHTRTFYPTDSGTYNPDYGSYVFTEVWCSDSLLGAYFFGTQIANSIPSDATNITAKVYLKETANYYPSSLATIGTHSLTHKSGSPTPSRVQNVSAGSGWKSLSSSIASALASGSAYGLATDHGGYHIFAPKGGSNGAVQMTWIA